MATMNVHINFNGKAEEAFLFYKSVFGGEFLRLVRFKDFANPGFQPGPEEENNIMHISLPIGKYNVLMGNDVPSFMGKVNENEHRSKISISTESKEEAEHIYSGLSAGGTVEMPLADAPWGAYFSMFRDKYGIEWMVEYTAPGN